MLHLTVTADDSDVEKLILHMRQEFAHLDAHGMGELLRRTRIWLEAEFNDPCFVATTPFQVTAVVDLVKTAPRAGEPVPTLA